MSRKRQRRLFHKVNLHIRHWLPVASHSSTWHIPINGKAIENTVKPNQRKKMNHPHVAWRSILLSSRANSKLKRIEEGVFEFFSSWWNEWVTGLTRKEQTAVVSGDWFIKTSKHIHRKGIECGPVSYLPLHPFLQHNDCI